jgi:quinolinate synthase
MPVAAAIPAPTHELQPYKSLENDALAARIQAVKRKLGPQLLILGHHYQQDEVIAHADLTGDSYRLSQLAAENRDCRYIAFCGVHFMAETADILANRPEKLAERGGVRVPVILPDMAAGCSMADMAAIDQIEDAWDQLGEVIDTDDLTPVTYINSAASLKAFVGRHGAWRHRVHIVERRRRHPLVVRPHQPSDVFSRPAPGSQHSPRNGNQARPDARLERLR